MSKPYSYVGKKYGVLTILDDKIENHIHYVYVHCDRCGNNKWMRITSVKAAKSCGCLREELLNDSSRLTNANIEKNIVENVNVGLITKGIPNKDNPSGCNGVSLRKSNGKWVAQIGFKNKNYYLGEFVKLEDAIKARKDAEIQLVNPLLKRNGLLKE